MEPAAFKAIGKAAFGLITRTVNGKKEFLVAGRPEIGSFDYIELGPSVQWEPTKRQIAIMWSMHCSVRRLPHMRLSIRSYCLRRADASITSRIIIILLR